MKAKKKTNDKYPVMMTEKEAKEFRLTLAVMCGLSVVCLLIVFVL